MNKKIRIFETLLVLIFLTSCQINPNKKTLPLKDSGALSVWEFKGRVAIKTSKESHIIRIIWKQNKADTMLRLYGSFGKTYAYLETHKNISTLKVDDKTYHNTDPQRLLYQVLGWNIPVKLMQTWVKGFIPQDQKSRVNSKYQNGHLKWLQFNPWTIDFDNYKNFQQYALPTKLKLIHPKFSIKFSIQSWTIGSSS